MIFSELIKGTKTSAITDEANVNITGMEINSRKVKESNLFIAIGDTQMDGHQYIPKAIELGAAAILCEEAPQQPQPNVTYAVAKSTEDEIGKVATHSFGDPPKHLRLVDAAGTNRRTAVATLLYNLFGKLGHKYGLLSTVCSFIKGQEIPANHTIPDPIELDESLAEVLVAGCEYIFMKCSSRATAQKRIGGLISAEGIFTNLTRNHLDYHKTFESYHNTKKSLFSGLSKLASVVIDADDKDGMVIVQNTKASVKTYSIQSMADFKARITEHYFQGMYLAIGGQEIGVQLTGKFNVSNLLAVYDIIRVLGGQCGKALIAMSTLHTVNGRIDTLWSPERLTAIVDHAHTPDALKNVLLAIREVDGKRHVITVCDAGGSRDKGKRPLMAKQAVQLSDKVIITSDNPRFEDPQDIINNVLAGLDAQDQKKALTIADRKEAIRTARTLVQKQDVILVAGKGREAYQEIKGVEHHFDDKEVLRDTSAQQYYH